MPEHTIVEGDHVVSTHSESWTWDDDHSYTLQFATYQRVDDGVIAEWRDYSDMGGLMAAAPAVVARSPRRRRPELADRAVG